MTTLPAPLDELVRTEEQLFSSVLDALRAAEPGRADRLPDARVPYFARMRIRTSGRRRDLMLGFGTFIDPSRRVTIVDWRAAPLAAVFFNHEVGDTYEEEVDKHVVTGVVEHKSLVWFTDGQLAGIATEEVTLTRAADGWEVVPPQGRVQLARADDAAAEDALRLAAGGVIRRIPVVVRLRKD